MLTLCKLPLAAGMLAAMALSTIPGENAYADEASRSVEDLQTEPVELDTAGELLSTFALGSGSKATQVEFYALPDGYGGHEVGILEISRGGMELADFPHLKNLTNPRELFHAFAKPGAAEPPLLASRFEKPKLGKPGWARDVMKHVPARPQQMGAVCNWNSFANAFDSFHPEINGLKFWYSSVSPTHDTAGGWYYIMTQPGVWWKNYASNAVTLPWNNRYHNYTFYNVDAFKTAVKVCNLKSGNQYQDRFIQFRYRTKGNQIKAAAFTKQLNPNVHIGATYRWYWVSSGGQKDWDWVTLVGGSTVYPHAFPDDHFYVAVQKK